MLLDKRDATIQCAKTIINFITIAQYKTHDEQILSYIKQTLYRINKFKIVFAKYKSQDTIENNDDENESYFNIFKLHIIIHYIVFIRLYDNTQNFDILYSETVYKFLLKVFYILTNKIDN